MLNNSSSCVFTSIYSALSKKFRSKLREKRVAVVSLFYQLRLWIYSRRRGGSVNSLIRLALCAFAKRGKIRFGLRLLLQPKRFLLCWQSSLSRGPTYKVKYWFWVCLLAGFDEKLNWAQTEHPGAYREISVPRALLNEILRERHSKLSFFRRSERKVDFYDPGIK